MGKLAMTGQRVGPCAEMASAEDETSVTGSVEVLGVAVALS